MGREDRKRLVIEASLGWGFVVFLVLLVVGRADWAAAMIVGGVGLFLVWIFVTGLWELVKTTIQAITGRWID